MDRYIPGVPCWVDTSRGDPQAAADFYGELFGWEFDDRMPAGAPGSYLVARLRGGDVAAIGSAPDGAAGMAAWNTYVWTDSAAATADRVRAAGGQVVQEPLDVGDAGRMAVFAAPDGAAFRAWEPRSNRGATVVNEHGSVNFNDLYTHDPEGAERFYGAVFGWTTLSMGGGAAMWTLPGYGDHLERLNPGTRERMAELGAPAGFEDVVATLTTLGEDRADEPSRWGVTFAADDADAVAERAERLGGRVLVAPFDAPWVRMAVIADPDGAAFTASAFVPENQGVTA